MRPVSQILKGVQKWKGSLSKSSKKTTDEHLYFTTFIIYYFLDLNLNFQNRDFIWEKLCICVLDLNRVMT